MGVVGLALCGFVLLVVSASVLSRSRGPVLGCQSMVAPACVVSRPCGMSTVRGGGETSFSPGCCVVSAVSAALADEGLVIPIGPCSRGSPPYFLQLGARRRESSVSDGLQRRLWRHVLSATYTSH
ncbi:hypothetical protein Taro_010619 [Colocasia esculenta]|uniref:Secreted protein n=1 Tax=Colocasia esculenta TaxID=4460 RepID=A0A843U857_COLES|nr:hypothetical protein [Colocasia esculenta]